MRSVTTFMPVFSILLISGRPVQVSIFQVRGASHRITTGQKATSTRCESPRPLSRRLPGEVQTSSRSQPSGRSPLWKLNTVSKNIHDALKRLLQYSSPFISSTQNWIFFTHFNQNNVLQEPECRAERPPNQTAKRSATG